VNEIARHCVRWVVVVVDHWWWLWLWWWCVCVYVCVWRETV
jgi:hypothetical protein